MENFLFCVMNGIAFLWIVLRGLTFLLKGHRNTTLFGTVQRKIDIVLTKHIFKYTSIKVARPSLHIHYPYISIITEDDWTRYVVMTFLNLTKSKCKYWSRGRFY